MIRDDHDVNSSNVKLVTLLSDCEAALPVRGRMQVPSASCKNRTPSTNRLLVEWNIQHHKQTDSWVPEVLWTHSSEDFGGVVLLHQGHMESSHEIQVVTDSL